MSGKSEPKVYGPRARAVARGLGLSVAERTESESHYLVVADSDESIASALALVEKGIKVDAVIAWGLGAAQVARLTRKDHRSSGVDEIPVVVGLPTSNDWQHHIVDPALVEALVPIEERFARRHV